MPNDVRAKPASVKRLVFQQIVEGDFRKFRAQSNDADTGGGARDLRFRPYDKFEGIFRKLFPGVRSKLRRRKGANVAVEILVGELYWADALGNEMSKEITFEPPTDARSEEGRIPTVHLYPPFSELPPSNEGRIVLLLIQRDDGTVWPAFGTEASLQSGAWAASVANPILRSLNASRPANHVARGYIDFESLEEFSDA